MQNNVVNNIEIKKPFDSLQTIAMKNTNRTYLITGAAGFIGANICRKLVEEDALHIHAFVNEKSSLWRINEITNKIHLHHIDLTNKRKVQEAVREIRPDIIYHLAAYGAYSSQNFDEKIIETNIIGSWNLLSSCAKFEYELFVNVGSSSEYGNKMSPMKETSLLEPDSMYAVTKSTQTNLCQYLAIKKNLPIVTFRLFSVYGPYEEPTRLIPNLIMAAVHKRSIDMVSPHTSRDFIYIDDVIDSFLMIDRLKKKKGEIFNIGTGIQTSLKELVDIVSKEIGYPLDARWEAMQPRTWDKNIWVSDITKARKLLQWEPKVLINQGIGKCITWFENHCSIYK